MTRKLLSVLVAAIPAVALADAPPKPVANLERFVGTWKGTGTMTMGKDKQKVDFTTTCKRTSAQFGVLCNSAFAGIPGMGPLEETDLFGYEPNSNTYHWFAVTNAGETHDHVAKVSDGNKLSYVYTGTQEGKPFKETIDLEWTKDGKTMTFHVESIVAGQVVATIDAKPQKQ
jgi:hypothetical protein